MPAIPSTRRNFYLSDEIYAALESKAKQEKKSAADILRVALVEHLDLPRSLLPPSRFFEK